MQSKFVLIYRDCVYLAQIALDRNTLEGYLELEREIAEEEHKNPIHPLELKKEQLARLSREVKEKQDILQNVEAET